MKLYEITFVFGGMSPRGDKMYLSFDTEEQVKEYCKRQSIEFKTIIGCFYTELKGYARGGIEVND